MSTTAELPKKPSRLDLVKQGVGLTPRGKQHGRLVVSIEQVIEDPRNERKVFRNMAGIITSVKANGVVEPLTVTPHAGDSYMIITGHRRFRAAKAAGLDKIEVLIRDPEADQIRRRKSIVSNVQREDVGPVEMAEALQSLLDEDEGIESQQELANVIGKGKVWVSEMLRILTLPASLQEKVRMSELAISADAVAKIARLDDEKLQEELINDLLGGATVKDIRDKINVSKGRPTSGSSGGATGTRHPKVVYNTKHEASVIIQATGETLTPEQVIDALKEASKAARKAAKEAA